MNRNLLVLSATLIMGTAAKAQSAVAVFKPLYSGDEHYGFATGSTESSAKQKSLSELALAVDSKVASGTQGQRYIYKSTSKKGGYAVGRGRDQYGHYWHYEAALGYDSEEAAQKYVLSRLAGRGLSDAEILSSGVD